MLRNVQSANSSTRNPLIITRYVYRFLDVRMDFGACHSWFLVFFCNSFDETKRLFVDPYSFFQYENKTIVGLHGSSPSPSYPCNVILMKCLHTLRFISFCMQFIL